MTTDWLDSRRLFLGAHCPLPLDEPFTMHQATAWGVTRQRLRSLVSSGLVRPLLREVYVAAQAPDSIETRAKALGLVIPETAVITDRTAAWLHGVDVLPRGAVGSVPPISVFHTDDTRVRRPGVAAGRRGLLPTDRTVIHGVQVTTALRTALDLGRLLRRFDAMAAIDGFLRIGVPHEVLLAEIERFRGYRGVRQLRALAPLGDGLAESVAESALRLYWYDAGLPTPVLQFWEYDDAGAPVYRLDITLPEIGYCAEYDGEDFHTSPKDRAHDEARREWLSHERGWDIDVFTKEDVYGPKGFPPAVLRNGFERARKRVLWTPTNGLRRKP